MRISGNSHAGTRFRREPPQIYDAEYYVVLGSDDANDGIKSVAIQPEDETKPTTYAAATGSKLFSQFTANQTNKGRIIDLYV